MQTKPSTQLRSWLFYSEFVAWIIALAAVLRGARRWALVIAGYALGVDIVGRVWSRQSPVPMPFSMQWVLLLPRGPQSPQRFTQVLQPKPGEHILEIGAGIGVHALAVAPRLLPAGILDVLDLQQAMLDELMRRATKRSITNIVAKLGDAQQLPYPEQTFDAVYMIGVIGEIPDAVLALREIQRVLKPSGRLVIGELVIDPDFIPLSVLHEKARAAGFVFERNVGPQLAYTAVYRPIALVTRTHPSFHSFIKDVHEPETREISC